MVSFCKTVMKTKKRILFTGKKHSKEIN